MNARIFVEGGGESKDLHTRCRRAFHQLMVKCGFGGRLPRLVAGGSRGETYRDFKEARSRAGAGCYVAMLVDSEEPVADAAKPWDHLRQRDGWANETGADDDQVLLMVTCMETWIITDRAALQSHYGKDLQKSALPALTQMESRPRGAVQEALEKATKGCKNAYKKGKRSFEVLGKLNPAELEGHLPSFVRFKRILDAKL